MRMVDIIIKKRNGEALSEEEISFIVDGYVKGDIPDYQMSALLMAIYFRGMNLEETINLTRKMAYSGKVLDLSGIPGIKVDKHSTGGVGDKTTLVFAPLIASMGYPVAKMSGRSLGHTGGTIDKLESIPGFKTSMKDEEFIKQVKEIGIAIVGQTEDLVPADKKIYALRDVTGTVDSIPLIASSVMSKKIASGSDVIILDVKVGKGAFIKDINSARELAKIMVGIGKGFGKRIVAVLSQMDQPLGFAVGNSLEIVEAIETLKGGGPKDLKELIVTLGVETLKLIGDYKNEDEAKDKILEHLNSGKALLKFREMVKAQGGDVKIIDDYSPLLNAKVQKEIYSLEGGYVEDIDAHKVALSVMALGAGRDKKEDKIDLSVGIRLYKKVGDKIEKNEPIVTFYANEVERLKKAQEIFKEAIKIGNKKKDPLPIVLDIIS
ncbi:pyrimidine-nucleoside phosphorylase [Dictyoglomus thermophilum]|uniref:Pyrimidine-nucleoside phosphorylase n=2 Tax=Dictyoglomus thermophilum TaxID=14 RepID=B5YF72_DICT6|nr:pyrimidine-nucleoside phosphorylase [Dictyoglomus thermophilum]ACI19940.1 pyrimidine-nucleoside phosphorylase [Dictyoglomus thermophilum H-6-12]MCX7719903.1 pyrimidine-nucleoside phosphorylase [Dictyoglomus thermophilum]TYT22648.1 pyrimidine-nucleoside phosphorylase [Dictyoglomus thermophilum]